METKAKSVREAMRERIKELNCLYDISNIVEKPVISLDEILQDIVNLIPRAWQYPEITCATITLSKQKFKTRNYKPIKWKLTHDILVHGKRSGEIQVGYLKKMPELDEGPFLKYERKLINAIAERLGRIIERKNAEEELIASNQQLRASEQQLRESTERFRTLTENTSDWVWEIDENAVYTYTSPKIKELLGYEPEEIIGKTPFDMMSPDEAKRVASEFGAILEARENFSQLDNINMHKDKHLVMFETSGVPIFDVEGNFRGYRGIDRDITERKNAEEELIASNQQLRAAEQQLKASNQQLRANEQTLRTSQEKIKIFANAVAGAIDAIVITDIKGLITHVNPAMERMYGYKKGEMIGKSTTVLNANPAMVKKAIATLKKTGSWNVEILQQKKNKKTFPALLSLSTVNDEQGKPIALMGAIRDITERKKAEKELKESEQRFRAIFEQARDGFLLIAENEEILEFNDAAHNNLKYTREEFEQLTIADIDPDDDDNDANVRVRMRQISAKGNISFEARHRAKNGEIRNVQVSGKFIELAERRVFSVIWSDITELKKAQEEAQKTVAIRESAEMMDTMSDGVAAIDVEGKLTMVNTALEKIAGYTKGELIGKPPFLLFPETEKEKLSAAMNECLKKGIVRNLESIFLTKDKKKIPVMLNCIITKDAEGRAKGHIATFRDVTELKKLTDELNARVKELEDFHDVAVGRELEMVKLEKEIESLKTVLSKVR